MLELGREALAENAEWILPHRERQIGFEALWPLWQRWKSRPRGAGMTILRSELELAEDYVAPRSETEKRLAEIWRVALNLDRVGVDDSYFWLPGDSLIAARIFAEIGRVFDWMKSKMETV